MGPASRSSQACTVDEEDAKNDAERKKAMVSPLQVLKDACSSRVNLTLFVLNPKNAYFVGLTIIASVVTLFLLFHAGWQLTFDRHGFGTRTEFCTIVLVGLWFAALSTLFQVSLQDSIDRIRALNGRMEEEIKSLGKEVDGLQATSEELAKQLGEFDGIRKEMEDMATKQGVDFKAFFDDTNDIFDNMKSFQLKGDLALLEKAAADIEFLDNKEGMSKMEFKRFCDTVPKKFRAALQHDYEETFKQVAGADGIIDIKELRAFLQTFVEQQEKSDPQAGEP